MNNFTKDNYVRILLFLILLITIFFRFYNLASVPPSPSLDEVTTGYNAYSILNTGRDEYGYKFPILLRAYDDYRPAGYVYFVIPFIKLFGLTPLAVRLPSALLSTMEIVLVYFLVKLFNFGKKQTNIALVSALLLAISPWHIYISRLGHEVNLGLFSVILGVFFFFLSIKREKYSWSLLFSAGFFSLSLYGYQSEKVFSPIFVLLLGALFLKELLKRKKILILSVIAGILIALPAVKETFSPVGLIRFRGTSAFTDIRKNYQDSAEKLLSYKKQGNLVGQIIENRRLVPFKIFFANYFSHLKPEWLYSNGGNEQFKAPGVGLFYPWEMLLFFAGLFFCLKISDKRVIIFLLSWIGFSFIAPSITTGSPHAMRAFNLLPAPQIFEAVGIVSIFTFLAGIWRKSAVFVFILMVCLSSVYFFHQYFYVFPKEQSNSFQYALYKSIQYILSHKQKNNQILFSNSGDLTQSYMFYLFESKYNPAKYLEEGGTKSGGFAEFHKFDSVDFRPIIWDKDRNISHVLIVGNVNDFPAYANILYRGYYLDGKEGVRVVEP